MTATSPGPAGTRASHAAITSGPTPAGSPQAMAIPPRKRPSPAPRRRLGAPPSASRARDAARARRHELEEVPRLGPGEGARRNRVGRELADVARLEIHEPEGLLQLQDGLARDAAPA